MTGKSRDSEEITTILDYINNVKGIKGVRQYGSELRAIEAVWNEEKQKVEVKNELVKKIQVCQN